MEAARVLGRPSRAAVKVALEAHVAVMEGRPLRAALSEGLAEAPKLGGQERRFVAFAVRELSRHLRRLDLSARTRGWGVKKLNLLQDQVLLRYALWRVELTGASKEKALAEVALPGPIRPRSAPDSLLAAALEADVELDFGDTPLEQAAARHSFPTWLAEAIEASAPAGEVEAVLEALNREPALSFRVRPPGTRDQVAQALRAAGHVVDTPEADPDALQVAEEGRSIFDSKELKAGRLEVMDLGSQRLVALCQAQPGQKVVDYCAGAGGKTLALADAVGPTGLVEAHDTSKRRLEDARRRVRALGLKQVSFRDEPRLKQADIVLVDAPCSGVGTLAREPDQKWKLKPEKVKAFATTQLEILDTVGRAMRPGAVLVYGTCSLLKEEDEAVVERFLATHPGFAADGEPLRVWPHRASAGGFFGARLKKK